MSRNDNVRRNALNQRVFHIGAGFKEREHPHVIETLSGLGPHLGRWHPTDVDVEVSLQDRGGKEQRVTLRTSLPGRPPLVAVAENPDITRALGDAQRELIRQIEQQTGSRYPRTNRQLRSETTRHPGTSRIHRNLKQVDDCERLKATLFSDLRSSSYNTPNVKHARRPIPGKTAVPD